MRTVLLEGFRPKPYRQRNKCGGHREVTSIKFRVREIISWDRDGTGPGTDDEGEPEGDESTWDGG